MEIEPCPTYTGYNTHLQLVGPAVYVLEYLVHLHPNFFYISWKIDTFSVCFEKTYLLSKMDMLGIYVKFQGCIP